MVLSQKSKTILVICITLTLVAICFVAAFEISRRLSNGIKAEQDISLKPADVIHSLGEGWQPEGSLLEVLGEIDRDGASIASSIETTYTWEMFRIAAGISWIGEVLSVSSVPRTLYGVNDWLPVEYYYRTSEDVIYAVYRVYDQSVGDFYAYCFFRKLDPLANNGQEDTELWFLGGRILFIRERLSYSDFESIGIGSSLTDVVRIDPMAQLFRPIDPTETEFERERWNSEKQEYEVYIESIELYLFTYLSYKTYHYTDEGLVCIFFTREDISQEFTVSEIGINGTFVIRDGFGYNAEPISLRIAEEDLPPRRQR